jgi:hypothetical protein
MKYNEVIKSQDLIDSVDSLYRIVDDLHVMMEREFETVDGLSEDTKLNILIGMIDLHKCRFNKTREMMEAVRCVNELVLMRPVALDDGDGIGSDFELDEQRPGDGGVDWSSVANSEELSERYDEIRRMKVDHSED